MRISLVLCALLVGCGSAIVAPAEMSCPNALAPSVEMWWRPYIHGLPVVLDSAVVTDRYLRPIVLDTLRLPVTFARSPMRYSFGAGHCVTLRDSLGVNFWSTR